MADPIYTALSSFLTSDGYDAAPITTYSTDSPTVTGRRNKTKMNDDNDDEATTGGEVAEPRLSTEWVDLTRECLINILSRLTLEQRWRGPMFVCKPWLSACQDSSLHSVIDLEPHFDSLIALSRWWDPYFGRKIDSNLSSVITWSDGSLIQIRTRHCSDRSLTLAAERCPNLEVLSTKSCPNVTDASMAQIAYKCSKLRELDISFCYEISHESLVMIGRNCPNLKILKRNLRIQKAGNVPMEYLNSCPVDGDSEASAIAKFMPNLEHLELQFAKLSGKGLVLICDGCLNLEYFDLSGCENLRSRDVANAIGNLKNLKEFKSPNMYIPTSSYNAERYGHWMLYDERFRTDVFRF